MVKRKVCHFVCGLQSGGAEQVIYNYCSKLNDKNYEFFLAYQHEPHDKNIKEFSELNFKLYQLPSKRRNPFKNFWETYKYIKTNKFDVIHSHMNLINFIPLFCGWLCGAKIRISHCHTCDIRKKNWMMRGFEFICKKLSILFATDLVACGNAAGEYMYGKNKYVVFNNAIDFDKFKYNSLTRKDIRKQLNIPVDAKVIGHVGRFTEAKNHLFLLNVFKSVVKKDSMFYLLLVGDGELKEELLQYIEEKKLKNVILTGSVGDVYRYYNAMDLFVLPSRWEGIPLAGIEAQVAGLKCFFSINVSEQVLISSKAKVLSLKDSNEWINTIVMENCNYDRELNLLPNNFNIKEEVKKLEKLYNG